MLEVPLPEPVPPEVEVVPVPPVETAPGEVAETGLPPVLAIGTDPDHAAGGALNGGGVKVLE